VALSEGRGNHAQINASSYASRRASFLDVACADRARVPVGQIGVRAGRHCRENSPSYITARIVALPNIHAGSPPARGQESPALRKGDTVIACSGSRSPVPAKSSSTDNLVAIVRLSMARFSKSGIDDDGFIATDVLFPSMCTFEHESRP
jgi:hypothetical protein